MLESALQLAAPGSPDSRGLSRSRYLGISAVYGFLFLLCFYLGSFFALAPGGSLWYPAAGLRLAALLIFGWRLTPGLVVAEILAVAVYGELRPSTRYSDWSEDLLVGQVPILYGAAVFVLKRFTSFDPRLRVLRDTTWLVAVAILAPAVGAAGTRLVQILVGKMAPEDFVASTYGFFIGDTIGNLMLAPVLLMAWYRYSYRVSAARGTPAGPFQPASEESGAFQVPSSRRLLLDVSVIWVLLLALHLLPQLLDRLTGNVHWYLAFLPMIWISFRHGLAGSILGTLALTTGAAWLSYLPAESIQFHELQMLVMFLSVTTLLMGSAISSQRRVESQLERQNLQLRATQTQLEASNAELARFNYTIAHDLRNPLVTISNFAGLLRREVDAGGHERLAHPLERLEKASVWTRLLLDDLFKLSQVGIQAHPPREVPFGRLVREVLEQLERPLAESGTTVEVAVDLPTVRGDPSRLQEALAQLIVNALCYRGDEPKPRIEIGIRQPEPGAGEGFAVFYVRDNGIGVAPEYHERVFQLFERLAPEESGSTGTGLTLVQRIVEIHGGRVWLESDGPGTGSTFCFTLPTAEPAAAATAERSAPGGPRS